MVIVQFSFRESEGGEILRVRVIRRAGEVPKANRPGQVSEYAVTLK